jgi:glycine hydroxymethyltransferase
MKESHMSEVAEYIKKVAVDNLSVKEEVTEFMGEYTKVHYAFKNDEAYKYIEI